MLFVQDLSRGGRVIDPGSYPVPYPPMVYLTGSSPRPTHPSDGSSVMMQTQDPPPPLIMTHPVKSGITGQAPTHG
jgi:hypothetical protein